MKVEYKGKVFKKGEFYKLVCNFIKKDDVYHLPNFASELTQEEVYNIYKENKKTNTFLYIIFPTIVFGSLFLVINALIILFWNYLNIKISIFCIFISLLYLFFFLNKLLKLIRKDACYLSKTPSGTKYNMITKEEDERLENFLRGEKK